MKLLLHACCAPCSIQCVGSLAAEGLSPELYWYNPNIHPYTEYRLRRDSLNLFAEEKNLPLIMDDVYGLRSFIKSTFSYIDNDNGKKDDDAKPDGKNSGRCAFCYRLRLEKTARLAAERAFDAFSTTLLISPYQDHEFIRQTGTELAADFGINFLYRDFRPLFRGGQNQARIAGYYMQKYCGCVFSEEERFSHSGRGR